MKINGLMIADFMTPRGRRDFTYPAPLLAEIEEEFGSYRLHLSQTYAEGNVGAVLDELFDELEYKAKVAEYLMTRYEWDAFFQYFWGTDRIQHELWHIIDDEHPRHNKEEARLYRDRVYEYFSRVDEIVGRLIELAGADPLVLIASDHGFGPAHKYCSLNIWLLQEGFLKLKPDVVTRSKEADVLDGSDSGVRVQVEREDSCRASPCTRSEFAAGRIEAARQVLSVVQRRGLELAR